MDKQNWEKTFLFASAMVPEGTLSDNGPFGSGKAVEIHIYPLLKYFKINIEGSTP